MKERPIVFSTEMVRAILEGRKTMTRRLVKSEFLPSSVTVWAFDPARGWVGIGDLGMCNGARGELHIMQCPYGKPGDRLWVKETFLVEMSGSCRYDAEGLSPGEYPDWLQRASVVHYAATTTLKTLGAWKSPRFMPRWASRILLETVSVRVERVQDISAHDAYWEGLDFAPVMEMDPPPYLVAQEIAPHNPGIHRLFIEPFKELWNTIHAKKPESQWDQNPWVWVIEFKVVTP